MNLHPFDGRIATRREGGHRESAERKRSAMKARKPVIRNSQVYLAFGRTRCWQRGDEAQQSVCWRKLRSEAGNSNARNTPSRIFWLISRCSIGTACSQSNSRLVRSSSATSNAFGGARRASRANLRNAPTGAQQREHPHKLEGRKAPFAGMNKGLPIWQIGNHSQLLSHARRAQTWVSTGTKSNELTGGQRVGKTNGVLETSAGFLRRGLRKSEADLRPKRIAPLRVARETTLVPDEASLPAEIGKMTTFIFLASFGLSRGGFGQFSERRFNSLKRVSRRIEPRALPRIPAASRRSRRAGRSEILGATRSCLSAGGLDSEPSSKWVRLSMARGVLQEKSCSWPQASWLGSIGSVILRQREKESEAGALCGSLCLPAAGSASDLVSANEIATWDAASIPESPSRAGNISAEVSLGALPADREPRSQCAARACASDLTMSLTIRRRSLRRLAERARCESWKDSSPALEERSKYSAVLCDVLIRGPRKKFVPDCVGGSAPYSN